MHGAGVAARPIHLLKEHLMELKRILARALLAPLKAGHLELFRRYVHLLHEAAQHEVDQILVLLMDLAYVLVVLVQLQVGIKDCSHKRF